MLMINEPHRTTAFQEALWSLGVGAAAAGGVPSCARGRLFSPTGPRPNHSRTCQVRVMGTHRQGP